MTYQQKTIDTKQVTNHLKIIFDKAIQYLPRDNSKGTDLYNYQVEFCYYIDEIQRGPSYMISKVISECNSFINDIISKNNTK